MYLDHFGFRLQPFGPTPDPKFLYFSAGHTEALAALHYGLLERRGWMSLIAPPGMGKTTLLYHLMELWKGRAEIAFLCDPPETREQMLAAVLEDLGIAAPAGYVEGRRMLQAMATECRRQGKRVVLIFDEAQALSPALLEQIRLLSNFQTPEEKLIEIILAGQPSLGERLATPECEQLRRRVAVTAKIEKLDPAEVRRYVEHRLRQAGGKNSRVFTNRALTLLAEASGGVPGDINTICFEALSGACARGKKKVDDQEVRRALVALSTQYPSAGRAAAQARGPSRLRWVSGAAAVAALALASGSYLHRLDRVPTTTEAASSLPLMVVAPLPPTAPAVEETPPPAPAEERVQVQRSDNLRQIALRQYGRWDSDVWSHIRKHNGWLLDPDKLPEGHTLILPELPGPEKREVKP